MILVTGATGRIGRNVIDRLLEAGADVRALVRDPAKAVLPAAVEIFQGSLDGSDAQDAAFSGVERVFSLTIEPNLPQHAEHLVAVGRRTGVRHVVFLSSLSVEIPGNNVLKHHHAAAEQAYMTSGLDWTMLRGGVFDGNTAFWSHGIRTASKVRNFLRNDPYACIDPADVAAVAAKVLTDEGHVGKVYGLTGPELVTPEQQAGVIAELLGRPIAFEQLDEAASQALFKAAYARKHPEEQYPNTKALAMLDALRRPDLPWRDPRPDVEQVIGRKGATFRQWAERNIAIFA